MRSQRLILATLLSIALLVIAFTTVQAQGVPKILDDTASTIGLGGGTESISLDECTRNGTCSVQHILLLANSIIRWAVAVSGSIALLMYVIGGMWMIFSQGNSSRIERGKDIIIGTSVSLVFVLGGWLIIQFALTSFNVKEEYQLTPNSCGQNGQCPYGLTCDQQTNRCVEYCEAQVASKDPEHPWQCQSLSECGLTACEGSRCVKNKCLSQPNNFDFVCCWKP